MSLRRDRKQVRVAAERLRALQAQLVGQTLLLRIGLERGRPFVIVGGGLIAGWLIGNRQRRQSVRALASLASLADAFMRSPIGPLAVSALSGRLRRPARASAGASGAQG
jgi:hypothetical protein